MNKDKIIQARYGPIEYGQWVDVKPTIDRMSGVAFVVSDLTFTGGEDRWPGKEKILRVLLRENHGDVPCEFQQDETIRLNGGPENWEEVLYAERKPRIVGVVRDEPLTETFPQLKSSLEPVDGEPLNIVSARYGILASQPPFKDHSIDVRERVQSLVKDNSLDIVVNNSTLCPGQNPFRGKKKVLLLTYAWGDREGATVERVEKDWLIIGQVQRDATQTPIWQPTGETEVAVLDFRVDNQQPVRATAILHNVESPLSAPALNDYLIRKFSISPQRLRGPMPIELRDFHRNDLAALFAELGFKRGAEIGVAEGNYSEVLLKANPECELLLVDIWSGYTGNPQNKPNDKHLFAYNETVRKTKDYPHVDIRQGYSMDVVDGILYDSLDFCYVDANHLFDECVMDLIEWSKRVRSGGIVSGDDYYELDQKRWVGGGVVDAVQAYVKAHRIPIWYIFAGHKSVDFAWVKP